MNVQISRFTSVGYIKSMISLSIWHFFLSIRQLVSTLSATLVFSLHPHGCRSIYFSFLSFVSRDPRSYVYIPPGRCAYANRGRSVDSSRKRYNGQGKIVGVWVTGFYRGRSKSYFTSTTADHRPSLCIPIGSEKRYTGWVSALKWYRWCPVRENICTLVGSFWLFFLDFFWT